MYDTIFAISTLGPHTVPNSLVLIKITRLRAVHKITLTAILEFTFKMKISQRYFTFASTVAEDFAFYHADCSEGKWSETAFASNYVFCCCHEKIESFT